MTGQAFAWKTEFYTDVRGKCAVQEFIDELPATERAQIAMYLLLLEEQGTGLGMPYARPIVGHKPLWELRPGNNRVLYFIHSGRKCIILHAFRKKGKKTPDKQIAIAERRMSEYLERENER